VAAFRAESKPPVDHGRLPIQEVAPSSFFFFPERGVGCGGILKRFHDLRAFVALVEHGIKRKCVMCSAGSGHKLRANRNSGFGAGDGGKGWRRGVAGPGNRGFPRRRTGS